MNSAVYIYPYSRVCTETETGGQTVNKAKDGYHKGKMPYHYLGIGIYLRYEHIYIYTVYTNS